MAGKAKNAGNTVKLSYHLTNGSILSDASAVIVDYEVLTGLLDGSSVPRREPTPTYTHRATGQAPTSGDEEQIEVSDSVYPENDGLLMNRGLATTWDLARNGLDTERSIHARLGSMGKIIAIAFSSIILLTGLAFAFSSGGGDEAPATEAGGRQAPIERRTPPPVILPSE